MKILHLFRSALRRFFDKKCINHSAAIAYYAVLSLFPALLIIIVAGSKAYSNSSPLINETINYINTYFPGSAEIIIRQIYDLQKNAGIFALVSVMILLWSSASMFSMLDYVLNSIFDVKEVRTFIMSQIFGVLMMLIMYCFLLMSVIASFFMEIVSTSKGMGWVISGRVVNTAFIYLKNTNIIPMILIFVMFVILFRYLPRSKPALKSAVIGALATTFLWEMSKKLFLTYVIKQAASYQLIYGSLTSTICLFIWCYITSIFTLYGACFACEIETVRQKQQIQPAMK